MNPLGRLSSSSTALLTLLVLLFPALIRAALDPFPPTGDFVVELDDVSFERDVQGRGEEDFYLVEFYSPACSALSLCLHLRSSPFHVSFVQVIAVPLHRFMKKSVIA